MTRRRRNPSHCLALALPLVVSVAACAPTPKVRTADLQAWRGVSVVELETQPMFSSMRREVRPISDGSEMWIFSACESYVTDTRCSAYGSSTWAVANCRGGQRVTRCCDNQFLVRERRVEWYRPVGPCFTDCDTRPSSAPCAQK